ncbi:MAG TPA: AAA family ATPase [Pirellulales bacterium]|nr:AAA family ATPase [Pirellulales bacterium]
MAQHIQQLTIRAFRQLQDLELRQLGDVNLLVGENNCGKTTVLEAISAHCQPLDPLGWIEVARRREIKSAREPMLDAVRWLFPQFSAEHEAAYYRGEIVVQGQGAYPNLETRATFRGVVGISDDEPVGAQDEEDDDDTDEESTSYEGSPPQERGAEVEISARVPISRKTEFEADSDGICREQFNLWETKRFVSRSAPSKLCLPVATVSSVSHRVEQLQVAQLTEATLNHADWNVVQALQRIDPDVERLEILSRRGIRPSLFVHHRRTGFTPLSSLGDGVRRVLTIALNLLSAQNGVLQIDEIETHIHKGALTAVFEWIVRGCAQFKVQLVATTHSLEAIDALIGAEAIEVDNVVSFHLEQADGTTKVRRFSGDLLHRLRYESGLDVR